MTLFHGLELIITAAWGRRGPLDSYIVRKAEALGDSLGRIIKAPPRWARLLWRWLLVGLPFLVAVVGVAVYGRVTKLIDGESVPMYQIGLTAIDLTVWEYLRHLPEWALVCLGLVLLPWLIAFGTLGALFVAAGAILFPVTAVFMAAVAAVALLSVASVPELGPCAATIIVSPESAPPGAARIFQPDASSSEGFLLHSVSYTHPAALTAIADAMGGWIGSSPPGQAVVARGPSTQERDPDDEEARAASIERERAIRRELWSKEYEERKRRRDRAPD